MLIEPVSTRVQNRLLNDPSRNRLSAKRLIFAARPATRPVRVLVLVHIARTFYSTLYICYNGFISKMFRHSALGHY